MWNSIEHMLTCSIIPHDISMSSGKPDCSFPGHHHRRLSDASPVLVETDVHNLLQQLEKKDTVTLTYLHRNVSSQLQAGAPMCGIVGLSMAAELLRVPSCHCSGANTILEMATAHGLSKKGEILSTANMLSLATKILPMVKAIVVSASEVTSRLLLDHVLSRHALLVPYDCDKDHTPCLARGHNAHWCLIVGVAVTLQKDKLNQKLLDYCVKDSSLQNHYQLSSALMSEEGRELLLAICESNSDSVHVFARHGKSRHLALWSWDMLLQSNANLFELDPNRIADEYVVPSEGLSSALSSKIVILQSMQTGAACTDTKLI